MKLLSCTEYAELHGVNSARIRQLCIDGRILGAGKIGSQWVIPENADYPSHKYGRPKTLQKGFEKSLEIVRNIEQAHRDAESSTLQF